MYKCTDIYTIYKYDNQTPPLAMPLCIHELYLNKCFSIFI